MDAFETMLPIAGKNLVNLSNSFLQEMGAKLLHPTLPQVDEELAKGDYQNIILLLYDGMGSAVLDGLLPQDSFLRQHKIGTISSVFPATTVAATTSVLTGLEPGEHGWLGWDLYFADDDETISVYKNTVKDTNIPAKHKVEERPAMRYRTIVDRICEETSQEAFIVWPFDKDSPCGTLEQINAKIVDLCGRFGKKFIYAYYPNPDKLLHQEGLAGGAVKGEMQKINDSTKALFAHVPEHTFIAVTADHGHIACRYHILSQNPALFSMLDRTTGIETRACALTLKPGADKGKFEKLFWQAYGNDFKLYTKEDVKKQKLFGENMTHRLLESNLGDYLAVAIKDSCLLYDERGKIFKTNHAGITKEEMEIPLIVLRK